MSNFSPAVLERLRADMKAMLSQKRFAHTLGVEECAARMARLLCPEQEGLLRAAALLHDCTKEYDAEKTAQVLAREGIALRPDEAASPAIHHAITAPPEIARLYPDFANPVLLLAVRWHTTGHACMTLCETILYLADVIEQGRTYPACVALRDRFWSAPLTRMTYAARLRHLHEVLLSSLTSVRDSLLAEGAPVCEDTLAAIADLNLRKTF